MTTAIQTVDANAQGIFSPAQEQMILRQFLGGATRDEAAVLLEMVKRRRLDPFAKQVHFVKRWDSQKREEVWAIQVSIDGLRSIADRSGVYEGQTKPEWCGLDGVWRDVWLEEKPPAAARVGVYKARCRDPLYGIARWGAYVQTKKDGSVTQFWAKMPDLMLAKCAEALAIRKAFPEDTGGLYVPEEMGNDAPTPTLPPRPAAATTVHLPAPETGEVPPDDVPGWEAPAALDLAGQIAAAQTKADLEALIPALKAAPAETREALRAAYSKRRGEVK